MIRRAALLALFAALLLPSAAQADHRETVLASPTDGSAFYAGSSGDGRHVYFATSDALVPEDRDGDVDLYDRHDGRTDLVSVAEPGAPGGGRGGATFAAATNDGGRVYFITGKALTADDGDDLADVYLRTGGHTRLVSRTDAPFNFLGFYFWCGASDDGGHVWFRTTKALAADDTDFAFDLYEYDAEADSLTMASRKDSGGNNGADVSCAGHTTDASQTFFATSGAMSGDDSDGVTDIYRRTASGTELMTPDTAEGVQSMATSVDGEHVIFESPERLVDADKDDQKDVYERTGGEYRLVSQGPESFNGDFRSDFQRASADGTRIFWTTDDHPVSSDKDDTDDVFVRMNGQTQIVSHGPAGGDAGFPLVVERINRAGTRFYFRTAESLTDDDHDFSLDSFEWSDGTLRRVSVASDNDDSLGYDAGLAGATEDGSRIFFTSLQSMDATDDDTKPSTAPDGYDDIFEHVTGGGSNFISTGPTAGTSPAVDAFFRGFSDDGEKVWWDTTERLTAQDTDDLNDVYESRVNHSPVVQAGATGTALRYRDGAAGSVVDPALVVSDPDTPQLTSATVRVTGGFHAGDALTFTPGAGITGSLTGDTLTLSGAASPADYQAVLRTVRFGTDGSGSLGSRSVSFDVTDGIDQSTVATRAIDVVPGLHLPRFTQAPAGLSSDRSPRFDFASDDGAGFECALDDGAFGACEPPYTVGPLEDGPHSLQLRERDGDAVSGAVRHEWTVDASAPAAPLLIGPDPRTDAREAELAFSGEPGATFECSTDDGPYAPCVSAVRLTGLTLGRHSFAVRQTDVAGNTGSSAAIAWEVVETLQPRDQDGASLRLSASLGSPLMAGFDGLPVGCRLSGAFLRRCDVVVQSDDGAAERAQTRGAGAVVLGRGSTSWPEEGRHRAVVHAQLSRAGVARVRRRGRRGQRVRVRVTARSFDGRAATTTANGRVLLPGRYVVPAAGGYGTNVADLSRGRRTELLAVARQLVGVGEARCEGHADGSARRRHAHRLALRRAATVCEFLRLHGVRATLVVRSFGDSRPRATNATKRGRALNRRVEVVVVR